MSQLGHYLSPSKFIMNIFFLIIVFSRFRSIWAALCLWDYQPQLIRRSYESRQLQSICQGNALNIIIIIIINMHVLYNNNNIVYVIICIHPLCPSSYYLCYTYTVWYVLHVNVFYIWEDNCVTKHVFYEREDKCWLNCVRITNLLWRM